MNKLAIDKMHDLFGKGNDKCKSCSHLRVTTFARTNTYFKCECYGVTSSKASDWREYWTSCGLHNKMIFDGFVPVIKRKMQKAPQRVEVAQGQISIFDKE